MTTQRVQPVIPEKFRDILALNTVAHVATLGPHGEPQSTPVWFLWDGQRIKISLTTSRQKYRNLRRDPRVAISLVDPQNPYRSLEIRGMARLEEDPGGGLADELARKYLGVDKFPYHQPGDQRVAIIVEPQHCTAYGSERAGAPGDGSGAWARAGRRVGASIPKRQRLDGAYPSPSCSA